MANQLRDTHTAECQRAEASNRPVPPPSDPLHHKLVAAQARRITELEQRLSERTRILTHAAQTLAAEISRREQALAALYEAQKLEALGQLAGGLAHDLRNVLSVMSLGYQVLQRRTEDAVVQKVVHNGSLALKQANKLIGNLLGSMRQNDEPAQVIAPANWLMQMEEMIGYAAGHFVDCHLCAADDTWPVCVDENRLGAALINLSINARDAMPEGGELTISVENLAHGATRPATVAAGEFVVFTISDTGCGMPPEVLERATEALFTTKAHGQGTGFGLYMVRSFVAASAGCLSITSHFGVGTQVQIFLPRSNASALSLPPDADLHPPRQAAAPSSHLLLVDNDDLIRPAIAAMLRDMGYKVTECDSTNLALTLLHTIPRLALVVTDVHMPGTDGPALVKRLRQERPGLPAILISGHDLPSSPMSDTPLLRKPFSREQLREAVQAQLQDPASSRKKEALMLDRLIVRLRAPALLAALLEWRDARAGAFLPCFEQLRDMAPQLLTQRFIASCEGDDAAPAFRFLSVGSALLAQLGGPLADQIVAPDDEQTIGKLASAYRRAARSGLPSYEYARYTLDEGQPVLFERLILPASVDGRQVSHLLGFVLISNPASTSTGN